MIAKYYRDRRGIAPVDEYLSSLPVVARRILIRQMQHLSHNAMFERGLPFPYSSQVRGDLRELRCHVGSRLYRVLYRRSRQFYVLLHIFQKQTTKIPKADIAVAEARWADFKARMDAFPREGLRPLGADVSQIDSI
jgi:phage-related protein